MLILGHMVLRFHLYRVLFKEFNVNKRSKNKKKSTSYLFLPTFDWILFVGDSEIFLETSVARENASSLHQTAVAFPLNLVRSGRCFLPRIHPWKHRHITRWLRSSWTEPFTAQFLHGIFALSSSGFVQILCFSEPPKLFVLGKFSSLKFENFPKDIMNYSNILLSSNVPEEIHELVATDGWAPLR